MELTYTLDASTLAGTTIVVFETLYSDGVEIAAHADINDEAQTVEITEPEKPTLGTTATVDGQHTAEPTGKITIVDVVEYTGLTPGETYTVSGVLLDKANWKHPLGDGAEVTAEVEFTPESADGTVELTYTLDASSLAGTSIVVFETLYSDVWRLPPTRISTTRHKPSPSTPRVACSFKDLRGRRAGGLHILSRG